MSRFLRKLPFRLLRAGSWLFKSPLQLALTASLCLHVLFLAQVGTAPFGRTGVNAPATRVSPLEMRVVTRQAMPPDQGLKQGGTHNAPASEPHASDPYAQTPTDPANGAHHAEGTGNAGTAWLSLLQAHYFKTDALTRRPAYLKDIAPQASAMVPDADPQPVVATLLINALGRVDEVILSDGVLSQQARLFVSRWFTNIEFTPGMVGDTPVNSQLTVEVRLDAILTVQ